MPRIDNVFKKYDNVSGSTTVDEDIIIPAGKTWNILGVSMTAPGLTKARVYLVWNPAGPGGTLEKIYEAALHDKYSAPVNLSFKGNGARVLRISLVNNDTPSHFLGATVYYEEIG